MEAVVGLKKLSGLALALMMSIPGIVQAEEWIKTTNPLGPLEYKYNVTKDSLKANLDMAKEYEYSYTFDADSISVDKANKTVNVVMRFESFPGNGVKGARRDRNVTLYFSDDPKKCISVVTKVVALQKDNNKMTTTYPKIDWNNLKPEEYGFLKSSTNPYYFGFRYWQDFAYLVDLPNQDGTPYVEPKTLKLAWATSTDKFGVFYDPKSLKVKGNKVSAKIYLWYPRYNRYQYINSTLNYDKNSWQPSVAEDRRLSDNSLVSKVANSLLFRINPSYYGADAETNTVLDYFRQYVKG